MVISCNDNPMPKPEKMLSQDEMENILFDVAVLQAAEIHKPIYIDGRKSNALDYVFNKYEIDSSVYFQNHRYYAADVRKFKKMYKHINNRLQDAKTEIDSAKTDGVVK